MIYRVFRPVPALYHVVDYYWSVSDNQDITGTQYFYTTLLQTLAFNFVYKNDKHSFNGKTHNLKEVAYFFGQSTCPRKVDTKVTANFKRFCGHRPTDYMEAGEGKQSENLIFEVNNPTSSV